MKNYLFVITLIMTSFVGLSQQNRQSNHDVTTLFFAGGTLNLGMKTNYTFAGATPFLGATLSRHMDIGALFNLNFSSATHPDQTIETKKTIYGPGAFVKFFPINFLFIQGQYEHQFMESSSLSGGISSTQNQEANSFLMGGGISFGRNSGNRSSFYCSALWDLADNDYSPYKDAQNKVVPNFRAGVCISLSGRTGRTQYSNTRRSASVRPAGRVVKRKWTIRGRKRRW